MIKLSNVIFNYQSMPMMFDLHIQAQEKIAIIGESGAGKVPFTEFNCWL